MPEIDLKLSLATQRGHYIDITGGRVGNQPCKPPPPHKSITVVTAGLPFLAAACDTCFSIANPVSI